MDLSHYKEPIYIEITDYPEHKKLQRPYTVTVKELNTFQGVGKKIEQQVAPLTRHVEKVSEKLSQNSHSDQSNVGYCREKW